MRSSTKPLATLEIRTVHIRADIASGVFFRTDEVTIRDCIAGTPGAESEGMASGSFRPASLVIFKTIS